MKEMTRGKKEEKYRKRYLQELAKQRNAYPLWIEEHESVKRKKYQGSLTVRMNRMESGNGDLAMHDKRDIVIFVSSDGELADGAADEICSAFDSKEQPDIIYGDEDVLVGQERTDPWFHAKWSPDTFFSFFYFGGVVAVRRKSFDTIAWKNSEDGEVNLYDFLLKATEVSDKILHLEKILFHRYHTVELLGCDKRFNNVKIDALRRRGLKGYCVSDNGEIFHTVFQELQTPLVSVIISTKDNPERLQMCLQALFRNTEYPYLEVIVVDYGSNNRVQALIDNMHATYDFRYVYHKMKEEIGIVYNIGLKHAMGDYILFMRDNLETVQPDWLKRLVGQASLQNVGVVAPKITLAYSGAIFHAGVANTLSGPTRKLYGFTDAVDLYHGHNRLAYNMMAVGGECLLVKKDLLEESKGFSMDVSHYMFSVELCFRLFLMKRYTVVRNDVNLIYHPDKDILSDNVSSEQTMRYADENKQLFVKYPELKGVDPFYESGVQSVQRKPEYTCNYMFDYENPKIFSKWKRKKHGISDIENCADARIVIEKAGREDISYVIKGFSFLSHQDNALYNRTVVLKKSTGEVYEAEPMIRYRKDVVYENRTEQNVGLSGFVVRFPEDALTNGEYEIGIVFRHVEEKKNYFRLAEERLIIR